MAAVRYKDDWVLEAYDLALKGVTNTVIAQHLGIAVELLSIYKSRYPLLRKAIDRGHEKAAHLTKPKNQEEYFLGFLTPEAKKVWETITDISNFNGLDADQRRQKVIGLLDAGGKHIRQMLYLRALVSFGFKIKPAKDLVCISEQTLRNWMKDEEFARMYYEVYTGYGDMLQDALTQKIIDGDTAVIMMANKTFNKNRGFGETLKVDVSGKVGVYDKSIPAEVIDSLPLETKKQIIEAMEKYKGRKMIESKECKDAVSCV